jgi:hypothetical protein
VSQADSSLAAAKRRVQKLDSAATLRGDRRRHGEAGEEEEEEEEEMA